MVLVCYLTWTIVSSSTVASFFCGRIPFDRRIEFHSVSSFGFCMVSVSDMII